jgi:hypothetical protein
LQEKFRLCNALLEGKLLSAEELEKTKRKINIETSVQDLQKIDSPGHSLRKIFGPSMKTSETLLILLDILDGKKSWNDGRIMAMQYEDFSAAEQTVIHMWNLCVVRINSLEPVCRLISGLVGHKKNTSSPSCGNPTTTPRAC